MLRHLIIVLAIGLFSDLLIASADAPVSKPNIIVILVDDLGATDLGCYGGIYESPHIDQLARDGLKFTQAYSACTVCSPTRAALLTGRYPAALRVTDWIPGHPRPNAKLTVPEWTKFLPAETETVAERLKAHGYATASIGKWHLGEEPPAAHGFDLNLAGTNRGQPPSYFAPYKIKTLADGPPGESLTERLTGEAIKWIAQNRERQFFLYFPHFAVHTPIQARPEVVEKYRRKIKESGGRVQGKPEYAAMVESVDRSVGELRSKLDEFGLRDRTIIIFTSDNGGLIGQTTNLGLRAGKGSAYEGGVRVPAIALVPGVTKPGTDSATPVITIDWPVTLLELAGAPPFPDAHGANLLPLLRGETIAARSLFWHYPHYHPGGATPHGAIRAGDWKLIEFFEDDHAELYNLHHDPLEQHDLAASKRQKTDELKEKLHAWRKQVGAQMPGVREN